MATPAKKAPNPTDKHVGSRVRMRRMMLGMSQEKLGEALVKLSGASQATVDVRDRLTHELSSTSRLDYIGESATLVGTKAKTATIHRLPRDAQPNP